ncbi:MAG TPA: (Fe-S)-binding protein, partial [Anaerolineae bacterium]
EGIRQGSLEACLVELMACSGGCINGPVFAEHASVAVARQRVMAYARRRGPLPVPPRAEWPSLDRAYADRSIPVPAFSEEQIRAALAAVDKFKPEDELNCGSCGYPSCREKAAATLRGMAEPTMCIPYMRARAESLNDVVIEATPNAILIVDRDLRIQDLSPSAAQMFKCSRVIARGQPLAHIMPVLDDFETVRRGESSVMNKIVRIPAAPDRGRAELVVEASIVPVQGENLLVAILRDVTEREAQRLELERIRSEAILRSQEVINKQMRVAHEIAGLLGETTAETKVLLRQLTRLMEEQS